MSPEHAVLATYYRNNVLHLFAMPSLIACCFLSNAAMAHRGRAAPGRPHLSVRGRGAVPALVRGGAAGGRRAHARRRWPASGCSRVSATEPLWRRPQPNSWRPCSCRCWRRPPCQTIERYYLAIALLIGAGSGADHRRQALEERCQLMAQRMTMLYGINSPEFFDRSLFENFIDLLRARGVVAVDAAGLLEFDEVLIRVAADAQLVLSEQIRHSILQVTHP